jgi:hypothetical protein
MNQRRWLKSCPVILLLLWGCGPKVMIPPKIDLTVYDNVGIIGFGCDAEGNLKDCVTQRFLEEIRDYQKTASIIELGSEEEVLKSVQAAQLNLDAIRAIQQKYEVTAVFTGTVDIAEVTPIVELYPEYTTISGQSGAEGMRVKAHVKASLSVVLYDTRSGTSIWSGSVSNDEIVEKVRVLKGGNIVFDAEEPRFAYRDLVRPMIKGISADFKIRHKKK